MEVRTARDTRPETYPGYPNQRFTCSGEVLENTTVPFGPWDHNTHPLPLNEEIERFVQKGLAIDDLGRPLHPWADELLEGGVTTGKGAYWHWGPNRTADPIVITNEQRPRILLIERSDTGAFALPGGFLNGDEDPHAAAQRELLEETGFTSQQEGQLIYQGPVADLRTTLHSWAETSAYLFIVDGTEEVHGNDDALSADWYFVDELPDKLFGSHARLVALALESQEENPVTRVLDSPEHERSIKPLDLGHMAYRHYIARHDDTAIFVKEHDALQFNDPHREAHSRAYLAKEQAHYRHLQAQGFTAIPRHTHLRDDQLLAMEHFDAKDDWHWRAPAESQLYIEAVLEAFDDLQATAPMINPAHHQLINPTYETFWREGWDAIDEAARAAIDRRVAELSSGWSNQRRTAALATLESLEQLQNEAQAIDRVAPLFAAHNDARQSNIAWHPEQGVRIVDWSWADPAPKNADATMFLIDLAKSGHDVSEHLTRFNRDYAVILAGFWLAHSTWQARDAGSTVREHQVASAASALELIRAFDKNSY